MNVDRSFQRSGPLPEHRVLIQIEILAVRLAIDHCPLKPKVAHATLQLIGRRSRILHGQVGKAPIPARPLLHRRGQKIVHRPRLFPRNRSVLLHLHSRPGQRQHHKVDAVLVHDGDALVSQVIEHSRSKLPNLRTDIRIGLREILHKVRHHEVLFKRDLSQPHTRSGRGNSRVSKSNGQRGSAVTRKQCRAFQQFSSIQGRHLSMEYIRLNACCRVAITSFASPDAGGRFRRPPPLLRRRDRRRAEDARRAEGATSPGRRRAGCTPVAQTAPDDTSWCAGWVAITRFAQPDAAGVLAPATRRKHDTLLSRSSGGHQIVPIRLEPADLPFHRGADIPVVSQPSPRARYSGTHTSAEADRLQNHALPFQQESLL